MIHNSALSIRHDTKTNYILWCVEYTFTHLRAFVSFGISTRKYLSMISLTRSRWKTEKIPKVSWQKMKEELEFVVSEYILYCV